MKRKLYLYTSFRQIDFHGEIFTSKDVWVMGLSKGGFQLFQLFFLFEYVTIHNMFV